jgi:ATP-dependent Clp protease ATP-binding subunit ClpC
MLVTVSEQLVEKEVTLEVTDAAKDFLGRTGYDEVYGARPLRRVIQSQVEDKLSEDLLRGKFGPGDTILVDLAGEGEELVVRPKAVATVSGDEKA